MLAEQETSTKKVFLSQSSDVIAKKKNPELLSTGPVWLHEKVLPSGLHSPNVCL